VWRRAATFDVIVMASSRCRLDVLFIEREHDGRFLALGILDRRIGVENGNYHLLSRFEIGGEKRISQHLSGRTRVGPSKKLVSD
jgi:hypothetical protein